jgi:hypothetical protein
MGWDLTCARDRMAHLRRKNLFRTVADTEIRDGRTLPVNFSGRRAFQEKAFQEEAFQEKAFQEKAFQEKAFQEKAFQEKAFQEKAFQEKAFQLLCRMRFQHSKSRKGSLEAVVETLFLETLLLKRFS